MAREYQYYRHGNARMAGTLRELGNILGKTTSEMQTLVRYGERSDLVSMWKAGKMPEHVEEIPQEPTEYVLYDGEDIASIGTMEEIAEEIGVKKETVKWYGTPSGQARGDRALVKMDDDEEDYA